MLIASPDLTTRVDPRVRGEGRGERWAAIKRMGRSPRARGRRAVPALRRDAAGSIPACAGKASRLGIPRQPWEVDPRVRGEGNVTAVNAAIKAGRSPRARGRPVAAGDHACDYGSIPACAGKAVFKWELVAASEVDPRVRGEGADKTGQHLRSQGRSPRARGRPTRTRHCRRACGSIPACAGKAGVPVGQRVDLRVDPRVRGEGFCTKTI